jgi:hypothetical protein
VHDHSLDTILSRLVEIHDALAALPQDAYEERAALQRVRDDLRAEAATRRDRIEGGERRDELQYRLAHLERRLAALMSSRIDVVKQAGDLANGNFGNTADAMRINWAIEAAGDRTALEAEIADLRERLGKP